MEEFQNPDGRYIVTFDGAVNGNLIQIAVLVTEDAMNKGGEPSPIRAPVAGRQAIREYMKRNLRPDPVPDAIWARPASASGK